MKKLGFLLEATATKRVDIVLSFLPKDESGAPYPVMVWIHGGGYNSGANIQYSPHFLASRGVVVVVPNYRLDVIGR